MAIKLTYEYVYTYFETQNCKLLEIDYINAATKMKYKCKCGNISYTTFGRFSRGSFCRQCSSKDKSLSYDYVYNYFKEQGCELLEEFYTNSNTKMKYICECDTISWIRFNDFKMGGRCKECRNILNNSKFKMNFQFILEECKKDDTQCISNVKDYKNEKSILTFICPKCNLTYKKSWKSFGQKQRRCLSCSIKNRSGKMHYNYNKDRTRQIRAKLLSFDLTKIYILNDDQNYNSYLMNKELYQIDHIQPRIAFIDNNLDNIYGEKIIQEICNSKENLRIILKLDNISKGGKYNQENFRIWFNNKLEERGIHERI